MMVPFQSDVVSARLIARNRAMRRLLIDDLSKRRIYVTDNPS